MKLITNKAWEGMQVQMKALQRNTLADLITNFNTRIFPNWTVVKEMEAYQTLDQIYAVIKKLATCSALIPFYGYDQKGEDLPDSDPLVAFINTLDFEEKEKLYTYLYCNGEVWAYKMRVDVGPNDGKVKQLRFLHPDRMSLSISDEFPREIVMYNYFDVETGNNISIDLEDMIYIRFFNPSKNTIDEFRGLSAIRVLSKAIDISKSADSATAAQLQNGGVPGIVYDKFPQAEETVAGNRKRLFDNFLRNPATKGAPFFAGNELGYISLGTPLADMDVSSLHSLSFDRICSAFGVSTTWFNNKAASTESNVQEMIKEAYTNTIIPNVMRVEAALNKGLGLYGATAIDIKTRGVIKCDTSDIKALQEDQSKLVTALANAWWLTPNEKRTAQMYDQADDELMDKFLVPSGLVPLDDLEMPAVDNTAGDYNAPVVPLKTGTNG